MQPFRNLVQHARTGLEALAVVPGQAQAYEDGIELPAILREPPVHQLVDSVEVFDREVAPSDPRLVGRDDDAAAGPAQPCDGVEAPGNRPPLVRGTNVAGERLVDDAVPLDDDEVQSSAPAGRVVRRLDAGGAVDVGPVRDSCLIFM